jgi:hypothetical protein
MAPYAKREDEAEMGKELDELSKALASGTSRRVALKRFAVGVAGAAVASLFPGRQADAGFAADERDCQDFCRAYELEGREFGRCVAECAACRKRGRNYHRLNGNSFCA